MKMAYREFLWGLFFLFSAVSILVISFWKFLVYLEHSFIILFIIWEYLIFFCAIIVSIVAIVSMVISFYYVRTDITEEKSGSLYIKIIVIISVLFYFYDIFLVIDILNRW